MSLNPSFRLLSRGQIPAYGPSEPAELLALREFSAQIAEPGPRAEFRSLLSERDPELRGAGLRRFARRQETRGQGEWAATIYQSVAEAPQLFGANEARLAQTRLEALRGQGGFGAQFEIFAGNFVREVTDPATLAGMAFAGGAFQALRTAAYARLLTHASANPFTRGWGARSLAFGLAFAAEAPAFSFASRSTRALLGQSQDWGARTLRHELAATYLTLGALRLSGAAGDSLFRALNPSALGLVSRGFFQQAAMLGGVTGAHWLEQELGLRERTGGAALFASSLTAWLHFNAAGRVLHGLTGGGFTRRLRMQQERLENLPAPLFTGARWTFSGRIPALAGADILLMSGIDGNPSERPPPPGAGPSETRGGAARSSFPPPPLTRNVREDISQVGLTLSRLYDNRAPHQAWLSGALEAVSLYRLSMEAVQVSEEAGRPQRAEIVNHLRDLSAESEWILRLLAQAHRDHEAHPIFGTERHLAGQVLEQLYRSSNNFINFLDNTSTIPEPLQHLRLARFWLQYGLEKATFNGETLVDHGSGFPYRRGPDGSYELLPPERHVLIFGDENGPRTFQLAKDGHRVTHLDYDNSRLRTTQKLTDMRVKRAISSGQWRFNLEEAAAQEAAQEAAPTFHSRIQDAQPAEVVEAFFPTIFETLRPRSDSRRMEQLRELVITNFALKLKPEGTVFVISNRDDAIEDLAQAVGQMPHFELLELRQRQDVLPLRAGMHITAEPGESLYSWLIFRKNDSK